MRKSISKEASTVLVMQVLQFALSRQKAANSSCSSSCPTDLDIPQHMKSIADCAQQARAFAIIPSLSSPGLGGGGIQLCYTKALIIACVKDRESTDIATTLLPPEKDWLILDLRPKNDWLKSDQRQDPF